MNTNIYCALPDLFIQNNTLRLFTVSQRGINDNIFTAAIYISNTHTKTIGGDDVRRETAYWRKTEASNEGEEWS